MIQTCVEVAALCMLHMAQPSVEVTDYPAVMVIYDPSKGGINCGLDCSTVALGPLTPDMYYTSGACHPDLLGTTVYFPAIDFQMKCVDNGGLVTVDYNDYYGRPVVYFDAMWDADQPPYWLYWLLNEWEIVDYP